MRLWLPARVTHAGNVMWLDRSMWFDRDGIPISTEEAGNLLANYRYKRIARTTLTSQDLTRVYEGSTVWIGLDHGFMSGQPPLIFETMVFAEGSSADETCVRYATMDEAKRGHIEIVVHVATLVGDDVIVIDLEDENGPIVDITDDHNARGMPCDIANRDG